MASRRAGSTCRLVSVFLLDGNRLFCHKLLGFGLAFGLGFGLGFRGRDPCFHPRGLALDGSAIFVSDTHFKYRDRSPEEKTKKATFLDFLAGLEGASRLYLVGDIFDFWFEYQSVVPRYYRDVLDALTSLKRGGTDIFLSGGNHDFWYGSFLSETLGFTVLPTLAVHDIQGRRIAITHGDDLIPRDFGYKALKALIRSRGVIALARAVHPDLLFAFAERFSKASKEITEGRTERSAKTILEMAPRSCFRWGNDAFVMGHIHYPVLERFGDKVFVILGDWEKHFTYGKLSGGALTLERYKPSPVTFSEKR
jgi:UDP-2,3-diacylglucosamine hydrolase